MGNNRVNLLVKILFVVEILTKHGRGLLLFAAPCSVHYLLREKWGQISRQNWGLWSHTNFQ